MNLIKIQCLILLSVISTSLFSQNRISESYFPPKNGKWEKIELSESGWNEPALEKVISYAESQKSSGLLIIYKGKILLENYWAEEKDLYYEDVASVQKKSYFNAMWNSYIKRITGYQFPVNKYIDSGWSNSDIENENKILVKHLLSMTSGLDRSLNFNYPPGDYWSYNTVAYSKTILVLEAITNKDIRNLTQEWITNSIGIKDSKWLTLQKDDKNTKALDEYLTLLNKKEFRFEAMKRELDNPYRFVANLRDLGRIGLLTLNNGYWASKNIIKNEDYLKQAFQPSQNMNLKYGYLFWLNTNFEYNSNCPEDMIIMSGASKKRVYIIPSKDAVIVRLGVNPERDFDKIFLDLLSESMQDF